MAAEDASTRDRSRSPPSQMDRPEEDQQEWTFSDIVHGPFEDPSGPVAPLLDKPGPVRVRLESERVSFFRLAEYLHNKGPPEPDLIVAFGTWTNVLHRDVCNESGTSDPAFMPTYADRRGIQDRQKTVYDDPTDFLVSILNATCAQTSTSVLLVGPRHYIWRVVPNSHRPLQRFDLEHTYADHYQGFKKFDDKFMALYMPSSFGRQAAIQADGTARMPDLLSRFKRVLVMSAGRGKFWSQVVSELIVEVQSGRQRLSFCTEDPSWGLAHEANHYEGYVRCVADFKCELCKPPAVTCMRCLRRVKNWGELPNRKWVQNTAEKGVGTDDLDAVDNADTCTMM